MNISKGKINISVPSCGMTCIKGQALRNMLEFYSLVVILAIITNNNW